MNQSDNNNGFEEQRTFDPVDSKVNFVNMENQLLKWWEENSIVKKYLSLNEDSDKRWSFIDGPITANNAMGVHHAWGRSYKDIFQRYKTMNGFKQRYQNGFDGQGLWVEVEVEKEMGFNSKRDIEEFGIDRFVNACKARVENFANIITTQSIRLGYWMDWDNSYHTMSDNNNYTIWHFLKTCHDKGWLYEGTDVMPWCPRCGTGLSEHEIATEGYKTLEHESVFVKLPIIGKHNEYLVVWTTTPWTLTSNVAAAVNPNLKYSKVIHDKEILYVSKSLTNALGDGVETLEELLGKDLVGLKYKGPFDELTIQKGVEHFVLPWDLVSEDEGTGIVHIAPGCGKEDFALSKEFNLPVIAPIDEYGNYVKGFDWLEDNNVSEINTKIFESLKAKGILLRIQNYSHRYPVCWRCDSELIFRLVDEWFISMGDLRHLIADVTRKINWIPSFGLERELDWLKNMDDWMISKKRYWGLALPIYKCSCGHVDVIGSKEELKERSVEGWGQFEGNSPHRPWVDGVKIQCPSCNSTVSRIKDVGNPWLDAGIVAYSTLNYLDDRNFWKQWFPADWISESFPGQFRNWFYSLLTMSTVLENSEPFLSVFSYALMRDENGEEMHKSKGNSIEFVDAAERMGVDAMRWAFARHNPSQNLSFGYRYVEEVRRHFLLTLWNIYSFFVTYANIDNFQPTEEDPSQKSKPDMDLWILSELHSLISEVTDNFNEYDSSSAVKKIEEFVELLSNWYVRRNRRRFWKTENDQDKIYAYNTLYSCLVGLSKLIAPITPFLSEQIYQNLVRKMYSDAPESIHLSRFPISDNTQIDNNLSISTRLAMKISSLGRSARSKAGIKVRQPLSTILIKTPNPDEILNLELIKDQIADELNVKEIRKLENELDVLDFQVRINQSIVGPKYGAKLSDIAKRLDGFDSNEVALTVLTGNSFDVGGYVLTPEELSITPTDKPNFLSVFDNGYVVTISTKISPELIQEGITRELVHRIQNMRKSAGFAIEDNIDVHYASDPELSEIIENFYSYIIQETLSKRITQEIAPNESYTEQQNIENHQILLSITKIQN